MREIIKEAKSVDGAVDLACRELGVNKEQVTFEILDLPKKGLFGLGGGMARVKVVVEENGDGLTMTPDDLATEISSYLKRILRNFEQEDLDFEAKFESESCLTVERKSSAGKNEEEEERFNVALQRLGSVYLGRLCGGTGLPRVAFSINGLLQKKKSRVTNLAKSMAQIVLKTRNDAAMEPMSSYERMVVHNTIAKIPGVKSSSVGEGRKRRVIIYCNDEPDRGEQ